MSLKKPTAGIVLAAGMSTRLGRPKQLLILNGKYLLEWVLEACAASKLEKTFVVLGHQHKKIIQTLDLTIRHPRIQVVVNSKYREGQSQSLRSGLLEAKDAFPSVMFLLGDQPMVDKKVINRLLNRFWEADKDICIPTHQGKRRNPVIFSKNWYDRLLNLKGDIGARKIIEANARYVLEVKVQNPLYFYDIDTEEDYKDL
ncbi:MAG: nucleotidyltransferase family protein [Deltaproteobacteria bacterium]|nr:MAG: nucleotidyltransferase family protein [Deltaproteobacteria bacterium]